MAVRTFRAEGADGDAGLAMNSTCSGDGIPRSVLITTPAGAASMSPGTHHLRFFTARGVRAGYSQRSAAMAARSTTPITALAVKKASLTRERSVGRTSACSQMSRAAMAASAIQ